MKEKCNKIIGNNFETYFCNLLASNGFWAHNLVCSHSGRPADIIASKNQKTILVDCKVCKNDIFPLSRIEDNQHNSMTHWNKCGNGSGLFAIKLSDDSIYMLPYLALINYPTKRKNCFSKDEIKLIGYEFDEWVKQW